MHRQHEKCYKFAIQYCFYTSNALLWKQIYTVITKITTIKRIYIVVIVYNNIALCFESYYIHTYWILLSYRIDMCKFLLFAWNYLPAWNRYGNRTLLPALVIIPVRSSGISAFLLYSRTMLCVLSCLNKEKINSNACVTVDDVSPIFVNGSENRYADLTRSIVTFFAVYGNGKILVIVCYDYKWAIVRQLQHRLRSIVTDEHIIGLLQVLKDESFSMASAVDQFVKTATFLHEISAIARIFRWSLSEKLPRKTKRLSVNQHLPLLLLADFLSRPFVSLTKRSAVPVSICYLRDISLPWAGDGVFPPFATPFACG